MGLTDALFTGLSGLDGNQTWLSVTGNNIANVNTTAFKASQVQFSSQFYLTNRASTAADGDFGGTNPEQEGLGTQIASITQDFTPGQIETTGVDTDMAINGQGFFIVQGSSGPMYTRDGTFTLNSANQLVTSGGQFVQGYGVDSNGNIQQGSLGDLTIPLGESTSAKATQNVTMSGNLDASGDVAGGATILTSQAFTTSGGTTPTGSTDLVDLVDPTTGDALFTAGDTLSLSGTVGSRQLPTQTLTVTASTTLSDLETFSNQALDINTGVTQPGNPTPGATLQTSGTTAQFTIIGNTGTENALTLGTQGLADTTSGTTPLDMTAGVDGAYTNDPTGESVHTTLTAYDSLGTPVSVDVTAVLESKSATGDTWQFYATSPDNQGTSGSIVGSGTLTFNNDGVLTNSTGTNISIDRTGTGATSPLNIALDFSNVTALSSSASNLVMNDQDGSASGTLTSFSVGADGTITGSYSNGLTQTLGQVAIANFNNPQGLLAQGGNLYLGGPNSGVAQVTTPGQLGTGTIESGSLEESNVDLSKEFINLIIASTGFSASSKVITTSDELLTDLLNSQR